MGSKARILGGIALLVFVMSSCQMEMGVGAKLNSDGSGVFTMAIAVDKEFIDGLADANARSGGATGISGIQGFDEFFDSLKKQGWNVERTQTPAGDVAFNGKCAFPDVKGFDACVKQVGSADGGSSGVQFGGTGLSFDFGVSKGFFRTETFFAGSADLSGPSGEQGQALTKSIQALADRYFSFEIRAELPGSVRILEGGGSVEDGVAIWKPRVGEKISFRAESQAINPFSLVAIALPLMAFMGFAAWGLLRRRPSAQPDGFVTPREEPPQNGFVTVDEPMAAPVDVADDAATERETT